MSAFWSIRLTTVSMKVRSKTRRKLSNLFVRDRAASVWPAAQALLELVEEELVGLAEAKPSAR